MYAANMYRSASWSRVSDDYVLHSSPKNVSGLRLAAFMQDNELPQYDPIMEMAKKDKTRKVAENVVHLIPFIVFVCLLILWIFSNPDVDIGSRGGDTIAARIEGLTIEGDIDNDSDGTQTGFLPAAELGIIRDGLTLRGSRKLVEGF